MFVRKYILFVVCILAMFVQGVWAVPQTVKVGFFALEGFHEINADGIKSGFGYDFLQLLSRYSNLNFEYVCYECSLEQMQQMLLDGDIDVITALQKTSERENDFAFSLPVGQNSVNLNVRIDDVRYMPGDYANYEGMTVGLLQGSSFVGTLAKYAEQKGFKYNSKFYESSAALKDALVRHEVDAVATSSLRSVTDEKTISRFGNDDFYVMVRKKATGLLDEINYAITQMNLIEGDWRSRLYYKYYEHRVSDSLRFSSREMEYIKVHSVAGRALTVLTGVNRSPYSFVEKGQVKGIIPEIFGEVMKLNGMEYEFIVPKNNEEYSQMLLDSTIQVVLDIGSYVEHPDKWVYSPSYLSLSAAVVYRKGFNGKVKTAAVVKPMKGLYHVVPKLDDNHIIYCDTPDGAIRMVSSGRADVTYLYLDIAEQYANSDFSGRLAYSAVSGFTDELRYAVPIEMNRELISILSKSLMALPKTKVDNIVSKYFSYSVTNVSVVDFFSAHPMYIGLVALIAILLLVFIVSMLLRVHMKQRLLEHEYEEQRKLKRAQAEVTAANKAKSRFLFNMSHDIRTPMNAIIGFAGRAQRYIDDKKIVLDCIQKINISSDYLLQLINEVLDMARIESDKIELAENVYDLLKQSEELCNIFAHSILEKGIKFVKDFSGVKDKFIIQDSQRVRQIMTNILSNAIKYTNAGGSIECSIRQFPSVRTGYGSYCLSVKDTGIGMSKEFQEHVFDEFSREKNSTQSKVAGTGLGMSIVKRIVDKMGGCIDIQSEQGVGTTISVYIDFRLATEEDLIKLKAENPNFSNDDELKGKKILLVEDNNFNREIAMDILTEAGLAVETAVDGAEAVDLVKSKGSSYYDCILMDVQMPVMDGYEATRIIRRLYPDEYLPIIALSANAFEEDRKKSLEAGMYEHLPKPIVTSQLFECMKKLMM